MVLNPHPGSKPEEGEAFSKTKMKKKEVEIEFYKLQDAKVFMVS